MKILSARANKTFLVDTNLEDFVKETVDLDEWQHADPWTKCLKVFFSKKLKSIFFFQNYVIQKKKLNILETE